MLTGTSCISFIFGGDDSFSGIFSFSVLFFWGFISEFFVASFYFE